jgi:DNA-binding transcriptional MerR regulator
MPRERKKSRGRRPSARRERLLAEGYRPSGEILKGTNLTGKHLMWLVRRRFISPEKVGISRYYSPKHAGIIRLYGALREGLPSRQALARLAEEVGEIAPARKGPSASQKRLQALLNRGHELSTAVSERLGVDYQELRHLAAKRVVSTSKIGDRYTYPPEYVNRIQRYAAFRDELGSRSRAFARLVEEVRQDPRGSGLIPTKAERRADLLRRGYRFSEDVSRIAGLEPRELTSLGGRGLISAEDVGIECFYSPKHVTIIQRYAALRDALGSKSEALARLAEEVRGIAAARERLSVGQQRLQELLNQGYRSSTDIIEGTKLNQKHLMWLARSGFISPEKVGGSRYYSPRHAGIIRLYGALREGLPGGQALARVAELREHESLEDISKSRNVSLLELKRLYKKGVISLERVGPYDLCSPADVAVIDEYVRLRPRLSRAGALTKLAGEAKLARELGAELAEKRGQEEAAIKAGRAELDTKLSRAEKAEAERGLGEPKRPSVRKPPDRLTGKQFARVVGLPPGYRHLRRLVASGVVGSEKIGKASPRYYFPPDQISAGKAWARRQWEAGLIREIPEEYRGTYMTRGQLARLLGLRPSSKKLNELFKSGAIEVVRRAGKGGRIFVHNDQLEPAERWLKEHPMRRRGRRLAEGAMELLRTRLDGTVFAGRAGISPRVLSGLVTQRVISRPKGVWDPGRKKLVRLYDPNDVSNAQAWREEQEKRPAPGIQPTGLPGPVRRVPKGLPDDFPATHMTRDQLAGLLGVDPYSRQMARLLKSGAIEVVRRAGKGGKIFVHNDQLEAAEKWLDERGEKPVEKPARPVAPKREARPAEPERIIRPAAPRRVPKRDAETRRAFEAVRALASVPTSDRGKFNRELIAALNQAGIEDPPIRAGVIRVLNAGLDLGLSAKQIIDQHVGASGAAPAPERAPKEVAEEAPPAPEKVVVLPAPERVTRPAPLERAPSGEAPPAVLRGAGRRPAVDPAVQGVWDEVVSPLLRESGTGGQLWRGLSDARAKGRIPPEMYPPFVSALRRHSDGEIEEGRIPARVSRILRGQRKDAAKEGTPRKVSPAKPTLSSEAEVLLVGLEPPLVQKYRSKGPLVEAVNRWAATDRTRIDQIRLRDVLNRVVDEGDKNAVRRALGLK